MTPAEYDDFVWSRVDPKIMQRGAQAILAWAAHKAASEAGEVNGEIAKRDYHERDVSETVIAYEWGDVLYYVSAGAQALGLSLYSIMEMNVAKLTDRGDYANYLRQKMEATPRDGAYDEVIANLETTLRRYKDLAGAHIGEQGPAETPQPQHPESKAAAIVEMHKDAIRAIYDQYPGLEMEQDDT
jgi:hypothetical protein